MRYIDAEKLRAEIERIKEIGCESPISICNDILSSIDALQQEQPEYGYLSTMYIDGKKSRWNVGDTIAYYLCTSDEEGEIPLGKITKVEYNNEEGWVYTFEDGDMWDEQSLYEKEAYKKELKNGK